MIGIMEHNLDRTARRFAPAAWGWVRRLTPRRSEQARPHRSLEVAMAPLRPELDGPPRRVAPAVTPRRSGQAGPPRRVELAVAPSTATADWRAKERYAPVRCDARRKEAYICLAIREYLARRF